LPTGEVLFCNDHFSHFLENNGVHDNKFVTDSFSTVYTGIFGKCKNFVASNKLDRSAFEQSLPKGVAKVTLNIKKFIHLCQFFSVFKESQIFEQFVRSLQENKLQAFEELAIAHEKKQQEMLEASQNQGSFIDE
jgi:peptidyl-tRNA hydrolase